jgi:hypothetical protein
LSGVGEGLVYLVVVAAIAVVAIRLGMLLAPRLDKLTAHEEMTAPDDEDDGGRPD